MVHPLNASHQVKLTLARLAASKSVILLVPILAKRGLRARDQPLEETGDKLADLVSNGNSQLGESIGKVKPPNPPELAKLQFSHAVNLLDDFPLLIKSLPPQANGVLNIDLAIGNSSNVAAKNVDIWIQVCDSCRFAKEPTGFVKEASQFRRSIRKLLKRASECFEKLSTIRAALIIFILFLR